MISYFSDEKPYDTTNTRRIYKGVYFYVLIGEGKINKDKKNKALAVFQGQKIRRKWHNGEWYFSVVDIVKVLTNRLIQSQKLLEYAKK